MLSIRLKPDIERRLSDLAKRTGRTKTYYARELIEGNIEDLEDRYLAEARLLKRRPSLTTQQVRQDAARELRKAVGIAEEFGDVDRDVVAKFLATLGITFQQTRVIGEIGDFEARQQGHQPTMHLRRSPRHRKRHWYSARGWRGAGRRSRRRSSGGPS